MWHEYLIHTHFVFYLPIGNVCIFAALTEYRSEQAKTLETHHQWPASDRRTSC